MSIVNSKLKPLSVFISRTLPVVALVAATGYSSFSEAGTKIGKGVNSAVETISSDMDLTSVGGSTDSEFGAIGTGHGLYAHDGYSITESTPSSVALITANEGNGINVTSGGKVTFNSAAKIVTGYNLATDEVTTGDGTAIFVSDANSFIGLDNDINININGPTGSGIVAVNDGTVSILGASNIAANGVALKADSAGAINLAASAQITSVNAPAIQASNGSRMFIGHNAVLSNISTAATDLIELDGTGTGGELSFTYAKLSAADTGVNAKDGGWKVILDNSTLKVGKDAVALTGNSDVVVNALNGSIVEGNITAASSSKLNMTLDNQSTLTGIATGDQSINLVVNNKSVWNMSDSSQINSLALSNGIVKFAVPTGTTYNRVLTTNSLSGNGDFYIHTELNEGNASTNSDQIHVTGDAEGNHRLFVTSYGSGAYTVDDGIKVVQIDGNSTSKFTLGQSVKIDAYEYTLYEGDAAGTDPNDWYLRNELIPVPEELPVNPDTGLPVIPAGLPDNYRAEIPGYAAAPYVNMLYGYQTVGTLHERMGDTQQISKGVDNKTWGRFGGSHLESTAGRFNYDIDTMFAQFGRDIYQGTTDAGTDVTGGLTVTLGQEHTKAKDTKRDNVNTGDITTNAYSFGGYYTRYAQDGGYIDAVSQFTYYDNSYNSELDASQNSYGVIASLEGGKPFTVTENWKIEPQGQLAYQYLKSESFKDGRAEVKGDDYNSGLARAGVRYFRDQAQDKDNEIFKPYLTLDAVSTIGSDPTVRVGNSDVKANFDSTWWQAGAGITANAAKNTSFYVDAKYLQSFEGDLDGYTVHAGVQGRF
ncbi:autotransporter family protein [Limnobaculum parvum]|uniref:Autotransporter outer membrane beta-barrel domain-containing protein n=1 Tax=Limnobaculum parvum TaxID=2172103 RepID=A0A2Y9TU37_9GAMM|nr:autotransporter outer membrane beta-barrel domain-containing protein [Limnobaculum parvum]AWH87163.1 autotransporter outer membrane beta-barrel domain-containing protein [Limnobaculum parvum]